MTETEVRHRDLPMVGAHGGALLDAREDNGVKAISAARDGAS
jgi:hypothetical protein